MMRAAAPLALTGLLGLLLLEVLKIVMAPVGIWIIGILLIGLKIGLGLIVLGVAVFFVRRAVLAGRDRSE